MLIKNLTPCFQIILSKVDHFSPLLDCIDISEDICNQKVVTFLSSREDCCHTTLTRTSILDDINKLWQTWAGLQHSNARWTKQ